MKHTAPRPGSDPGPDPGLRRPDTLADRLMAAARTRPLDERVPLGFSRRVQARIAQQSPRELVNAANEWLRGFWQALIPACGCLALVLWLQPRPATGINLELESETEAAEISLFDTLDAAAEEVEL